MDQEEDEDFFDESPTKRKRPTKRKKSEESKVALFDAER